jgi:hypothetical protein
MFPSYEFKRSFVKSLSFEEIKNRIPKALQKPKLAKNPIGMTKLAIERTANNEDEEGDLDFSS